MDFIYNELQLTKCIEIFTSSVNRNNINEHILYRLNNIYNNKTNENGFIKKNSIKIISRSKGYYNPISFSPFIRFNITYSCLICKPLKDDIYQATIIGINKIGIISHVIDSDNNIPLNIIISKHIKNDKLDNLNIDDKIWVKISAVKFSYNSNIIKTIGIIIDNDYIDELKTQNVVINSLKNIKLFDDFSKFNNKSYINRLKYITNSNFINDKILFIYTYLIDINKLPINKTKINKINENFNNYLIQLQNNSNTINNNDNIVANEIEIEIDEDDYEEDEENIIYDDYDNDDNDDYDDNDDNDDDNVINIIDEDIEDEDENDDEDEDEDEEETNSNNNNEIIN